MTTKGTHMCNIANATAIAILEGNPLSIRTDDHDLYTCMLHLELAIFRARLDFIVTGERTPKMVKFLTTVGELNDKIQTNLGRNPPSTGSRRSRLRNELPNRLLCGDSRPPSKLGSGRRPRTPTGTAVGDADKSYTRDDTQAT